MAGCGVKAPPVPPDAKPPVIADLSHTLAEGQLTLNWHLAAGSPTAVRYTIYQSRIPLADKPCEGCPLAFKRLLSLPAEGDEGGTRILAIEPGYHYGFKMRASGENGLESPDSNTIRFDY
jgi:hypothetical protein